MKKIAAFILLLPVLFSGFKLVRLPVEEETRKLAPFVELKVYGRFDVVLVPGTEESVTLESEKENLDNVLTEVDESKLKVRMKTNYFQETDVKAIITFRQLNHISAGAGAVIDAGKIEGEKIILKANSGSDLKAEVIAKRLDAESTQGATMSLVGNIKFMEAAVNTGGQLQAYELFCDTAKVKVTMGGYAKVTVKTKLDASVNMGGNISYKGMPKEVKQSTNMGGSITELRE